MAEPILLHVYADEDGKSRIEVLRLRGETRQSEVSTSIAWWSERLPVRSAIWRKVEQEAPPDVPHTAPRRQIIVALSGRLEIEVSDGIRREVAPGDLIFVEDTVGEGHITRSLDAEPRVTLMLELGPETMPVAAPDDSDASGAR